ncbi:MAG: IS66 family transposase, partial [Planctomycetes bacterium]|nr:IS66 family transposase [Planctomycetota bacterium]
SMSPHDGHRKTKRPSRIFDGGPSRPSEEIVTDIGRSLRRRRSRSDGTGRGDEYPAAFLEGYSGFVHADGYAGYNTIHGSGARHLGCWAHVRRKFVDAQTNNPAKASDALAYIRTLYAVEKEIVDKKHTSDIAVSLRQARAAPIVKQFGEWLEIERRSMLPKSPFGEAVSYACNQWPTLDRYLGDARFTIDNNVAERAVRPLAVGRRYAQFRAMRSNGRSSRISQHEHGRNSA